MYKNSHHFHPPPVRHFAVTVSGTTFSNTQVKKGMRR